MMRKREGGSEGGRDGERGGREREISFKFSTKTVV